jgi:hypothetical protein
MSGRRCWRGLIALILLGSLQAGACSFGPSPEQDYFGSQKPNSCAGLCGSQDAVPGSSPECWCDNECNESDDCCSDWIKLCSDGGVWDGGTTASCKGRCGPDDPDPNPLCYCDPDCVDAGDCCSDYATFCGGSDGG